MQHDEPMHDRHVQHDGTTQHDELMQQDGPMQQDRIMQLDGPMQERLIKHEKPMQAARWTHAACIGPRYNHAAQWNHVARWTHAV